MTGPSAHRTVTVVVPVYDGLDEVRACLDSVRRWTPATVGDRAVDVLVIDDAAPDPAVRALVDEFAATTTDLPVAAVHQPDNLGFVRTANAGMAAAPGDVVLLNADTVVTEGWLEQLAAVADEPFVATVTPLTNHGSICTVPVEIVDAFDLDLDGDQPRIDEAAAFVTARSLHRRPELISGVGFCMWVTRAALDAVGDFDQETFGRGYGEEVDFCIRASRAGFRHLADDATFVFHHGGVSFGDESVPSQAVASRVIHDRYRFFARANRLERGDDPLRVPFAALRTGLHQRDATRPHVLHLLHAPPDAVGGTESHVRSLIDDLGEHIDFSVFFPTNSGFVVRTNWRTGQGEIVVDELLFPGAAHRVRRLQDQNVAMALQTVLDVLHVDAVHVQNLVNLSLAPFDVLDRFDGPVICSIHDLFLACPSHSVLYRSTVSCGLPDDPAACARCLPETAGFPADRLPAHRAVVARAMEVVDRWIVPSVAALDHLARVYDLPAERVEVIPHGALVDVDRLHQDPDPVLVHHEPLRLGFAGRGWAKKGLRSVNEVCEQVRGTSIEVHHFGPLVDEAHPDLHRHGPFDNGVLPDLLRAAGINVMLLPGHVPETFSYVMTEALAAGIPVIGARHGALGERIRAGGVGWTIDPERVDDLVQLVLAIDRCRDELWAVTTTVAETPLARAADVDQRYGTIYRAAIREHGK